MIPLPQFPTHFVFGQKKTDLHKQASITIAIYIYIYHCQFQNTKYSPKPITTSAQTHKKILLPSLPKQRRTNYMSKKKKKLLSKAKKALTLATEDKLETIFETHASKTLLIGRRHRATVAMRSRSTIRFLNSNSKVSLTPSAYTIFQVHIIFSFFIS